MIKKDDMGIAIGGSSNTDQRRGDERRGQERKKRNRRKKKPLSQSKGLTVESPWPERSEQPRST